MSNRNEYCLIKIVHSEESQLTTGDLTLMVVVPTNLHVPGDYLRPEQLELYN